jgi:protein transport protein SEC24
MAAPPSSSAMERECAMPLAFVATPFAPPEGCSKTEGPVPIVRSVDDNPVRCGGCRGYINPSVGWLENGSTWECNLCKHPNIVPDYYYSSLDGTGLRMDRTYSVLLFFLSFLVFDISVSI